MNSNLSNVPYFGPSAFAALTKRQEPKPELPPTMLLDDDVLPSYEDQYTYWFDYARFMGANPTEAHSFAHEHRMDPPL